MKVKLLKKIRRQYSIHEGMVASRNCFYITGCSNPKTQYIPFGSINFAKAYILSEIKVRYSIKNKKVKKRKVWYNK